MTVTTTSPRQWPSLDHEAAQLRAGVRRIIKREFASMAEIETFRLEGWTVTLAEGEYGHATSTDVVVGHGKAQTAFIGRHADVSRALRLETQERHAKGQDRREAMAEFGQLLGYPACCTQAYLEQAEQSESASFARLLHNTEGKTFPRLNNLFVLRHQLISHFPCDLSCAKSAAVGDLGLQALASEDANLATALSALLAAPITVWDRFRFVIDPSPWGRLFATDLDHTPRVRGHGPLQDFMASYPEVEQPGTRLQFDSERNEVVDDISPIGAD